MSYTIPEPKLDDTPTAVPSLSSAPIPKIIHHFPSTPHSKQPPLHNASSESTTQTNPEEEVPAPNAYEQAPTKALKSQQPAPTTQSAEPTDPSQVAGSIPKPPNWSSMTGNQKHHWNRDHNKTHK